MAAELESYNPQLPADPAGWSVADHIAALREVDTASTWAKVRITGMLAAKHGDGTLVRAAGESGIALSTLKSWRSVDKAFPVEEFGRPNFPVGVAEALMAHPHRSELVSREKPWTVREARKHVAPEPENTTPENTATPGSASPVSPAADPVTTVTEQPAEPDPEPHVHVYELRCGCGTRVPDHDVLAVVDRREAELKAARATVVQLEAEVASLKAELSAALEGAGQDTPGIAPDPALRPADSAYAPVRDVSGDLVPDYEDFGDPLPDEDDPLSWLNGDDRPVRPGGRR